MPVISFGGSYGGMLTAWFRKIYPNVVDGAISSSAPVMMTAQVTDPYAFWKVVTDDFGSANKFCPTAGWNLSVFD
jgi:hypothetical protein